MKRPRKRKGKIAAGMEGGTRGKSRDSFDTSTRVENGFPDFRHYRQVDHRKAQGGGAKKEENTGGKRPGR